MRKGHTEEASAIALRIGKTISKVNRTSLNHLNPRDGTKKLWQRVNQLTNKSSTSTSTSEITAEELNFHYAKTSTDADYVNTPFRHTAEPGYSLFSEMNVFYLLDRLHATAEGSDALPAWFLRILAPIISSILSHLFNNSLSSSHVPKQWKTAVIHPIPKVPDPTSPSDYRPISVVPILSRLVERVIYSSYLHLSCLSNSTCCMQKT